MAAPRKYDYDTARIFFVEGYPVDPDDPDSDREWLNLRELSDRQEIPYQRLRERASAERWTEQRKAWQRDKAADRQKRRMEKLGKQSIEFDESSLGLAKMGLQLVGVRMNEIAQMVKATADQRADAMNRLANGQPVDRQELWSQVRAEELERLAKAASTLQDIGRKALGTDVQNIDVNAHIVQEQVVSVAMELERDDPDRLAAFMAAVERAGLWDQLELEGNEDLPEDDDIVEADVVEEN